MMKTALVALSVAAAVFFLGASFDAWWKSRPPEPSKVVEVQKPAPLPEEGNITLPPLPESFYVGNHGCKWLEQWDEAKKACVRIKSIDERIHDATLERIKYERQLLGLIQEQNEIIRRLKERVDYMCDANFHLTCR